MSDRDDIRRQLIQQISCGDQTLAATRKGMMEIFDKIPHYTYDYAFELLDDLESDGEDRKNELDYFIELAGVATVLQWIHERILNGKAD
jgi:hypothetical protein